MFKAVLAVIVGYVAMALLVFATFSLHTCSWGLTSIQNLELTM